MNAPPIAWVTEAEVVSVLDLDAAIGAIETALPSQAFGGTATMEKTHVSWDGGHTLHALGGAWLERSIVGVKAWAHAGGAAPFLMLWDADDGHCVAIIEAFGLGQLRTAAMTAVATKWLARPDARIVALVGSGRQAASQAAAVIAVRPVEQVRVYSPTASHRDTFAQHLRSDARIDVISCATLQDAVGPADVITTVTRARSAFLHASDVSRGTHLNAVGAITPERQEIASSVVERCDVIVTDSAPVARRLAAELAGVPAIEEIAVVIARGAPRFANDLSLFKPMGLGLADVVLGATVLSRLETVRLTIPPPSIRPPRLSSSTVTS